MGVANSKKVHWVKWCLVSFLFLIAIAFAAYAWFVLWPTRGVPEAEAVDEYVYLNQGWGTNEKSDLRQGYYYSPQGTSMPQGASANALRYDWFVHLELPFSTERFANPDNMRRWRFIVDPEATLANPDQLPVGFTKHFNKAIGEYVLDISCAACHSGEIHYTKKNKRYAIRIDGGQAMHALTDTSRGSFAAVLIASLTDTLLNPIKFNRFAKSVLGKQYDNGRSTLKQQLKNSLEAFLASKQNNPLRHLYPVQEGYGRTDALGRIGNTVFGDHLIDKNYQQGGAPVSFPFLWNIWKFNWVQYNASVSQPLARNIGEALGVGAQILLRTESGKPLPAEHRFTSSVDIPSLQKIEHTLQVLTPPRWPEEIFGAVNSADAEEGRALFQQHCVGCHGPHIASKGRQISEAPLKQSPKDQWLIDTVSLDHIGTDSTAAQGFLERRYDLSSTGVSNVDMHNALRPLQHRKLLRDVRWRLSEIISLREKQALEVGQLPQLLSNYPSSDTVRDITIPRAYFNKIDLALKPFLAPTFSVPSVKNKPKQPWNCDINCQMEFLIWDIRHGEQGISLALNTLDISTLTEGEALNLVGIMIKNRYYADHNISYERQMCLEGFGTLDLPQQLAGYKPRPLAGVWATPPFLHNGSVPSIYQMLIPPTQRTASFYVGNREYDTVHLGYVLERGDSKTAKGFLFDTRIKGNFNTGHAFAADVKAWQTHRQNPQKNPLPKGVIGPLLSEAERMALIEYLKIHRDNTLNDTYEPDDCAQFGKNL